jgi:hypothetical protein
LQSRKMKEYSFYDTSLGMGVENAFQALALDEHRAPFAPALWEKRSGSNTVSPIHFVNIHLVPNQTRDASWPSNPNPSLSSQQPTSSILPSNTQNFIAVTSKDTISASACSLIAPSPTAISQAAPCWTVKPSTAVLLTPLPCAAIIHIAIF